MEEPHYPLYRKPCGPQRGSVLCGEDKNILHYPEIEPSIIQLIVWSLNLLSYFGLLLRTLTYITVTGDTEKDAASETVQSLAREANGSPEPSSCHIFYLSSSWDSPPSPARPSLPYQLMLSSLISYNYFTSSFPSCLLSLILKSGKPYPSGTKRRVAWG